MASLAKPRPDGSVHFVSQSVDNGKWTTLCGKQVKASTWVFTHAYDDRIVELKQSGRARSELRSLGYVCHRCF
jgi:predicted esterase